MYRESAVTAECTQYTNMEILMEIIFLFSVRYLVTAFGYSAYNWVREGRVGPSRLG